MRRLGMLAMAGLFVFAVQQPLSAQSITVGAKAGATFATVGGDVQDAEMTNGFTVGALASFGISPMFSIQPELLYTQKGAQSTEDIDGTPVTATFTLGYLQIPVLAKLSIPTPGPASPYLYAGPVASFRSGCTIGLEAEGMSAEQDCGDDAFKSTDFSVAGGAGLGIGLGAGEALVDVRYDLGLSSIAESTPDVEESVKNRAFSVSLGYAVTLGM